MKGKIITRISTDLIALLVQVKGKEKATNTTGISRWGSFPAQVKFQVLSIGSVFKR